jgi:hypothetical protein
MLLATAPQVRRLMNSKISIDYILVTLLVMLSGNPVAPELLGKEASYIILFLLFVVYSINKSKLLIDISALQYPVLIGVLAVIHFYTFGSIVVMASLGFLLKICTGLLAAIFIEDFFIKYIKLMAILAVISLLFYVPTVLGIDVFGYLSFLRISAGVDWLNHIGIHNFHNGEDLRNAGVFWEAGAFSGYLVIALYFVVAHIDRLVLHKWEVAALTFALISTQSTAGFVAGLVLIVFFVTRRFFLARFTALLPLMPFIFAVLIGVLYIAVNELDFISEKIQDQMSAASVGADRAQMNRFGNALMDLESISARPIAGWSGNPETRFAFDPGLMDFIEGQGNAVTGLMVRFGVIGFVGFFVALYFSAIRRDGGGVSAIFLIIIIICLLIGEQYINYPFIYALLAIKPNDIKRLRGLIDAHN